MSTRVERNDNLPPGAPAPQICRHCGDPLKYALADYHRFVHIRCLLRAVAGWTPPKGRPHYIW